MAQDIRKLFKNENKRSSHRMPEGHEKRFLNKLDDALPAESDNRSLFSFMRIAASIVVLIGLSFGAYKFFEIPKVETTTRGGHKIEIFGRCFPGPKKGGRLLFGKYQFRALKSEINT